MNLDLILAGVFYLIMYLTFLKYRDKFEVQSKIFVMYKTKWGLKLMEKMANVSPRFWHVVSYISIASGFLGMAIIFWVIVKGTLDLIFVPTAQPVLAPVLPGVQIPGAPVLSFWHWIIGILIIAVIHEFMHGVYCKVYKVKIKSSGFAFLGPILAAFVEPDEKALNKKGKQKQLAVLSAGPFANIVLAGFILLLLIFVINPLGSNLVEQEGVMIRTIDVNFPINQTTLLPGDTIDAINGVEIINTEQFGDVLSGFSPGEVIEITSGEETLPVQLGENPQDETKAMLGVGISHARVEIREEYSWFEPFHSTYLWFMLLFFWLFIISLGVGLFNLLPLGPVDGGRMFLIAALWWTKGDEKKAKRYWLFFTWACLLLIFINLLPYLIKLLNFLFGPVFAVLLALF